MKLPCIYIALNLPRESLKLAELREENCLDLAPLLIRMLTMIEEEVAPKIGIRGLETELACAVYFDGIIPAISIDAAIVDRIARLGASFDLDLIRMTEGSSVE